jgi:FKBP-type peptidyl-prolyl cis-trans isomerase FklB
MKIKQLVILCVLATLISCGKSAITSTKMKSDSDSLSYAFGVNIYYYTLQQDSLPLNPALIAKGFMEASEGKAFLDGNTSVGYINTAMNAREQIRMAEQAEQNKIMYEKNIQKGDSFLQKNRENPGVIVTPSGLQYKVITMGTGEKPSETDIVKVHYTGTLLDGTKFDSSIDRGSPAEFQVNGVIQGWVEALQLMPVGSKFMLYIPESLAYGANGAGDVIQPYSTLIFEVELLGITKQ